VPHHTTYYNVALKHFYWINGVDFPQEEPVSFGSDLIMTLRDPVTGEDTGAEGPALGYEDARHESDIVQTLHRLSGEKLSFDLTLMCV